MTAPTATGKNYSLLIESTSLKDVRLYFAMRASMNNTIVKKRMISHIYSHHHPLMLINNQGLPL